MSDGPRMPLARATAAAEYLIGRWQLVGAHVVGSVRRQRPEVGDLELIVPARPAVDDPECAAIAATMQSDAPVNLFAPPPAADPIGRALRGLKPGFLACALVVRLKDGYELPVQLYRYTPDNLGWMMLMRTGPADFGKWFLSRWKQAYRIAPDAQASVNGHLVMAGGEVVPVRTEGEAFSLCRTNPIAPERRDEFISRVQARSGA